MIYVNGLSERIGRALRNEMESVRMAYKNYSSLDSVYSKMKDPQSIEEVKDVVYMVNCLDCNNKCYIGTTGVFVHTRMKQHRTDVSKREEKRSALAHHAVSYSHTFDFDNPVILEKENHKWKREFMEELHIRNNENCVNIKSRESRNVSTIYTHLLRKNN